MAHPIVYSNKTNAKSLTHASSLCSERTKVMTCSFVENIQSEVDLDQTYRSSGRKERAMLGL